MDLDDNGTIGVDELRLILESFGEVVPPARLKRLIGEVRSNLAKAGMALQP